jgi:tetratricopeptide (TPR) repeat protein
MSADNRGADIYWIDARVIDELRNDEAAKSIIEEPLGDKLIAALYKNDIENSAGLIQKWLGLYPNSLDATVVYGSLLRKQKRYPEAEQFLDKSTTRWNENVNINMEKALAKFALDKNDEAIKLLAPIFDGGSQLREKYMYLSNSLFDMAKFEPSDEYLEKAMSISPHGVFWYNRACGYSHLGNKDRAFAVLDKATTLGYNERKSYEADPDLAPLRSDPRWKQLMKKLK